MPKCFAFSGRDCMVARHKSCIITYEDITKWYTMKCCKLNIKSDVKLYFSRIFRNNNFVHFLWKPHIHNSLSQWYALLVILDFCISYSKNSNTCQNKFSMNLLTTADLVCLNERSSLVGCKGGTEVKSGIKEPCELWTYGLDPRCDNPWQ